MFGFGEKKRDSENIADINASLLDAAFYGRVDDVKALLAKGADPHFKNEEGRAVLGQALCNIHLPREHDAKMEIIRLLLERGVNVNELSRVSGAMKPPLIMAGCEVSAVELLLDNGADVNLPRYDGYTPLMDACIEALVNQTPTSINERAMSVIRLLLEHGADTSLKNDKGETALDIVKDWNKRGDRNTAANAAEKLLNEYSKF